MKELIQYYKQRLLEIEQLKELPHNTIECDMLAFKEEFYKNAILDLMVASSVDALKEEKSITKKSND